VHHCEECDHDNQNLERDEDGDFVCEECGHVIPEDNALVIREEEVCTLGGKTEATRDPTHRL
jgi:transcription initiation factor TFIIIB Brf1 subunit/transcription initiation factor TFIIB